MDVHLIWVKSDLMQGHSCRAHPETATKAPQVHSLDMADYLGPVLGDVYKEANLKQPVPMAGRLAQNTKHLYMSVIW